MLRPYQTRTIEQLYGYCVCYSYIMGMTATLGDKHEM